MSEPAPPAEAPAGELDARESFGRYLLQQRELRGMTVQNVADATKLSVATLKALESDDYPRLPERVFVVGFVKAYAKAIGLSAEETVLRLDESLDQAPPTQAQTPRHRGNRVWWMIVGIASVAAGLVALTHFHWIP